MSTTPREIDALLAHSAPLREVSPDEYYRLSTESLTLSENIGYELGAVISLRQIGLYWLLKNEHRKALISLESALTRSEPLNDTPLTTSITANLALIFESLGAYESSLHFLRLAFAAHNELPATSQASLLVTLANVYLNLGEIEESQKFTREALKLQSMSQNERGIALCLMNLGVSYGRLEDYEKALSYFRKSEEIMNRLDLPVLRATLLSNICSVLTELDRLEDALYYGRAALGLLEEHHIERDKAIVHANIGVILSQLGKSEEAWSHLYIARELAVNMQSGHEGNQILEQLAKLYLEAGNRETADELTAICERNRAQIEAERVRNSGLAEELWKGVLAKHG